MKKPQFKMMKVVKKQPSAIKSNLKKRVIFRVNKEIPISNVGQIAGNIAIENEIKNYSIQFGMLKKRVIFRVNKEIPISNVGQIAGNIAIENEIKNYSIQFGMSGAYTDKDGVEHKSDIDEGKCTIILQEM